MTKYYCDICGEQVESERPRGRSIDLTIKTIEFNSYHVLEAVERPFVMCERCYGRFENALVDKFTKYILEGERNGSDN